MFCSIASKVKARKDHRCTSCGEIIVKGEDYIKWNSVEDSWFSNKMHQECYDAHEEDAKEWGDGQWDYMPYSYSRGSTE